LNWTQKLLQWYGENQRSFVWRETREPYKIWLSEVILQQTRTAQGLPYYERFIAAFPTIEALATASEDEVLKLWQGLGYYSRARNLHFTAQHIHTELKGEFPNTFDALLQLKGVGDYTASAIASICFDQPQAVVDGNVYRFLARSFGMRTPINSHSAIKEFKKKASELMGKSHPGTFNQAMMEFGALHCTPKQPKCSSCPFAQDCFAFNHNQTDQLPVKTSQIKIKKRFFNYLVVHDQNDQYLFEKRTQKGIWHNLYQFPLVESTAVLKSARALHTHPDFPKDLKEENLPLQQWNKEPILHKLSHQSLSVHFWIIESKRDLNNAFSKSTIQSLAVPVVIQNFIKKFF
jgi:A/G-specific adenine glycosylase